MIAKKTNIDTRESLLRRYLRWFIREKEEKKANYLTIRW